MINFSANSSAFNPLANLKPRVKDIDGINLKANLASSKNTNSNEILGYKVDKDGFFTAEFNEKAGIPKDFKIHLSSMQ